MGHVQQQHENLDTVIDQTLTRLQERESLQKEYLQAAVQIIDAVRPFLKQDRRYVDLLPLFLEPERIIMFRVPWMDDSGALRINRGYRVQYNSSLGPFKGGLRFHPSVSLSIMKFLAVDQTIKNALTSLPLGGAKGGSDFDPKGKSDAEVMRFCQSFMTELHHHIGPNTDVPAGDIGVGKREIGYLFGQYKRMTHNFVGTLTGKDVLWGGLELRAQATGYGVVYFARRALKQLLGIDLNDKRCAVSGAGQVAIYTAEKLIEEGAKVISLSDSKGAIVCDHGISRELLDQIKVLKFEKREPLSKLQVPSSSSSDSKSATQSSSFEYREGTKPWELQCDVAFPCATQNEVREEDARKLCENGCKAIFEGANMPCMSEAVEIFQKNRVLFGPAIAVNAGGVSVSQFEMAQNSQMQSWTAADVDQKLKHVMNEVFSLCIQAAEEFKAPGNLLVGANIAGFRRVARSMIAQGYV